MTWSYCWKINLLLVLEEDGRPFPWNINYDNCLFDITFVLQSNDTTCKTKETNGRHNEAVLRQRIMKRIIVAIYLISVKQ